MYCPNCGGQIEETQKFCRSCGANVSLVPQALTGQLPQLAPEEVVTPRGRRHHRHHRPISIERAAGLFFNGLGLIFVSFAARNFAPAGQIWWFWLLIPAFSCMGAGVGQYMKLREQQRQQRPQQPNPIITQQNFASPTTRMPEISAPTNSEVASPSSVTEHTTKHLDQ